MQQSNTRLVQQIRDYSSRAAELSDGELKETSLTIKYRAMTGDPVRKLIPEGFGLVVEAARRHFGYSHYDVQLQCGIQLALGRIAEMKTGEGKTLTATLPAFLHALAGRGSHVVTINDYLAERDRKLMEPVYSALGLTCGSVISTTEPAARVAAYRADITYGTAKEMGFDFLRDRLEMRRTNQSADEGLSSGLTMRGLHYVLVDEADSIMIDEAGTPLIIGLFSHSEESVTRDCFQWAAKHASRFQEERDFSYNTVRQSVQLTSAGRERVRGLLQTPGTRQVSSRDLNEYIENAIKVRRDFHRDKNYAIRDGEIVIIDEFTGRLAEGRQWQRGIHQSVEAKEGLEISPATRQAAQVTVQNFFRRYQVLSGMTGTAWTSRREFKKVYRKRVVQIPTHRPVNRRQLPTRVFNDQVSKFLAVIEETQEILQKGQAVLIGTRSVEQSELLAQMLVENGVEHRMLNAKNHAQEAEIVAEAGRAGAVTVATNMAGRGTDIKLEASVREKGGLHVILTEIHESARIDWQLIGRGSRQGDPGSFRIFASMSDEILAKGLGAVKADGLRKRFGNSQRVSEREFRRFLTAQRRAERKDLVDRMILLRQDKQRQETLIESGQDPYLDVPD